MSYFLIRSSTRLHDHVLKLPYVGQAIREWQERRGVRRRVKYVAYSMVVVSVAAALISGRLGPTAQASTVALATVGLVVVAKLPTIED